MAILAIAGCHIGNMAERPTRQRAVAVAPRARMDQPRGRSAMLPSRRLHRKAGSALYAKATTPRGPKVALLAGQRLRRPPWHRGSEEIRSPPRRSTLRQTRRKTTRPSAAGSPSSCAPRGRPCRRCSGWALTPFPRPRQRSQSSWQRSPISALGRCSPASACKPRFG